MEYLHRKDKKKTSAREDFEKRLLPKVREYLRKDFGKKKWMFNEALVGSTKRNLVLVGNEGFDMDYQEILSEQGKVQLASYRIEEVTKLLQTGKILEEFDRVMFKSLVRKITVLSNKEIEIEFECGITVRETL